MNVKFLYHPPWCRYLDMPKSIANRVSDYFEYLLARNHPGSDGMLAVSQLPTSMFRDISSRMYEDHVKKVGVGQLHRHPLAVRGAQGPVFQTV